MRRKFAGITFVGIGAVLILSALLLFLYTSVTDSMKAQENRTVYETLVQIAEQNHAKTEENFSVIPDDTTDIAEEIPITQGSDTEQVSEFDIVQVDYTPMTVVRIGSFDYVGYIEIPTLALSLPVLAESNDTNLKAAPCRQFGTPETDDFVIAGHNYRRHFANLYQLKNNDIVRFTDMDGDMTQYKIAAVQVVDATDVEAVLDTPYDLILYTCTYSGTERTLIGCVRTE